MSYVDLSRDLYETSLSLLGTTKHGLRETVRRIGPLLEDQWYSSGCQDFSVYGHEDYPYLMLDCYRGWSRMAAVNTVTFCKRVGFKPKSILDVYAGTGQTTVLFAKSFPDATVWFHNTEPDQVAFMKQLADHYGVTNIKVTKDPVPSEVVFASEAMEHVKDPLAFILPVLRDPAVKVYMDASSFTINSIGHFPTYLKDGVEHSREDFKRIFFNTLAQEGFHAAHTKRHFVYPRFYNGHPNVLVRHVNGRVASGIRPFPASTRGDPEGERVARAAVLDD